MSKGQGVPRISTAAAVLFCVPFHAPRHTGLGVCPSKDSGLMERRRNLALRNDEDEDAYARPSGEDVLDELSRRRRMQRRNGRVAALSSIEGHVSPKSRARPDALGRGAWLPLTHASNNNS